MRMVADGALVRVDIATNKEQCQDTETPKGGLVNKKKRSHPVVTGQQAAQRKNSPRQWGRPFGRAPREICPAISTHPHWGGDCTTTFRWQDVGAVSGPRVVNQRVIFVCFGCRLAFHFHPSSSLLLERLQNYSLQTICLMLGHYAIT